MYIHDLANWPNFTWNSELLFPLLAEAKISLQSLGAELQKLGFQEQSEASLRTLTEDVVKTSEIEGEELDPALVRSSIARKLGLEHGGVHKEDSNVEGIVDVILDATKNCDEPLTEARLFGWHSALFPTGRSGVRKILVGQWRDDRHGPMQVVSGRYGKEKVHFQAPGHLRLPLETEKFFAWFEETNDIDPLLKAGMAHFHFVTIHPFDDGNGRIARAIADLTLARADHLKQRYYSMSAQITVDRKSYYEMLEASQKATLDLTSWLDWFLKCLIRAIQGAEGILQDILRKARVWDYLKSRSINDRQRKVLNALLDDTFYGVLNSGKYAKMTKCSTDTANRDLCMLEEYGVLQRVGKGRGTQYLLMPASFGH
jgi:Fic family protein